MKESFGSVIEMIDGTKEGLSGFKLYQDEVYTQCIEFEYPEHWNMRDLSGFFSQSYECTALWIRGPLNKRNTCRTELSVLIDPLGANSPRSERVDEGLERQIHLIRAVADDLREISEDYAESYLRKNQVLSDHEMEVDGNRARELVIAKAIPPTPDHDVGPEGYNYQEGERYIERCVAFRKGSCVYELSYRAPEDEDEKYVEAYRRFLSTFRVLPAHQEEQEV